MRKGVKKYKKINYLFFIFQSITIRQYAFEINHPHLK